MLDVHAQNLYCHNECYWQWKWGSIDKLHWIKLFIVTWWTDMYQCLREGC